MNNKKIEFTPISLMGEEIVDAPIPASKSIPEWFKKTGLEINPTGMHRNADGTANKTIKQCIPFLDALTTGYMITLPCDVVFVDPNKFDGQRVIWDVSWKVMDGHSPGQLGKMQPPKGFEPGALKWIAEWLIKTPPGYSLLFTHPLNRFDLPFLTVTGIVDTDTYDVPVNIPCFIREDFYGKLPKGTPVAQVIPIKREKWKSQKNKFQERMKFVYDNLRTVVDWSYKLRWWNKKTYD